MRALCLLILVGMMTGCQAITHELQPHRLWRWNYYEPTSRDAFGTFSIDDPLPSPPRVAGAQTKAEPDALQGETTAPIVAPMPSVKCND